MTTAISVCRFCKSSVTSRILLKAELNNLAIRKDTREDPTLDLGFILRYQWRKKLQPNQQ